jgi:hypothetical protein
VINTEEALCLSLSLARKLVDARTGVGRRGEVSGCQAGQGKSSQVWEIDWARAQR